MRVQRAIDRYVRLTQSRSSQQAITMPLPIEPTTLIQRNPALLATNLDGEIVLMSLDRGQYYGLKKTSCRIWELLETPTTLAQLCAQLAQEYQAAPGQIEADVSQFMSQLLERQLIRLQPA